MESLALLVGHLVGDYVFQNDWMASKKTTNSLACASHCAAYTLAVLFCGFWFLSPLAIVAVGVLHFPVDRWRLARRFMTLNGQEAFATGPLSPWSVVVVDNTIHLVVLLLAGMAS
jgi:hypothetical protein